MNVSKSTKRLALFNLLGYILTIVMNGLAVGLPLNGKSTGALADQYPNLFVPSGFTFSIWSVIYLWVGTWVVYSLVQVYRNRDGGKVAQIGPYFLISCFANGAWILNWHYEFVFLSVLVMLAILGSLIGIYLRLGTGKGRFDASTRALVQAPFSIYLGWITIATVANVTSWLVNIGWNGWGVDQLTWTIIMVIVATLITGAVLYTRRDFIYALVPIWAFFGIVSKRLKDLVILDDLILTLHVAMGVIAVGVIAAVVLRPRAANA